MRFRILLLLSTVVGLLTWPVYADTVSIAFQEAGPSTLEVTGSGAATITVPFGTFSNVHVSAQGQSTLVAPDILFSDTISTSTGVPGTLTIWITDSGLTQPLGTLAFHSSFTANELPAGWTLQTSTFVSSANALFSGTPLSSANFSAIGTNAQTANGTTGSGPYSVTEEFVLTATGAGDTNDTIDLSAQEVPEPPPVIALGLGLIGVGFLMRRRVQSAR